jgi:uroporphyrinogen decarboxylase
MIEGSGSDDFRTVKAMLYQRPDLLHHILEVNTRAVTDYLNAQIEAGAQAVMIFDTSGGMLSHRAYHEFSLAYMARVVERLKKENEGRRVPSILFTKGGGLWLEDMAATGCDGLGLDWTIDIGEARKRVGNKVALQGNFDPLCLMGSPEAIANEVEAILESYGPGSGHVFNLGHGINQHTPPGGVDLLLNTVRKISPKYHAG